MKTKKVFVQHIETLSNSEVKVDVLRSFVVSVICLLGRIHHLSCQLNKLYICCFCGVHYHLVSDVCNMVVLTLRMNLILGLVNYRKQNFVMSI